jgi:hypothetical protein
MRIQLVTSLGFAAAACGGAEDTADDGGKAPEEETSRCLPVSKVVKQGIAEGLTVTGGGRLGRAAAVRSEDFKKVWYVSAVIRGPDFGDDAIGTWATNTDPTKPEISGLIMAADSIAREFSDWGEAAEEGSPAAEVRGLENDGAQESRDCL